MITKRFTKNRLKEAIFGCLFAIIGMFSGTVGIMTAEPVYATPVEETVTDETSTNQGEESVKTSVSCADSAGDVAWFVCPATKAVSEAVDFLYEKIEPVLVINPVEMKDGQPIYEIWKYMRGLTNIVFIIFLLVVVYSQLTGYGITNYGVKKMLPKLIVAAILVNLSFVICSLAVDVSNVIGNSLRGVFDSIGAATMGSVDFDDGTGGGSYALVAAGLPLAFAAGVMAFESGIIWMLIPTALGALVAVVVGLVTIALRQAVVALLIMISPLAVVAYILPNTEQWFKKWKDLLTKMLVFYPMFSLLFGASALAGGAIMASAKDSFMMLLGVAVQIFPLFFSWTLMKMSGTVLGTINSKLTSLTAGPLAVNRSWAESHRDATKAKNMASGRAYTPSLALMQYLSNRKIAREEERSEHEATVKNRGLAYAAMRNYKKNGMPSREGERAYEEQARNMRYTATINRHKHNMNSGFWRLKGYGEKVSMAQQRRLEKLDWENIDAADDLRYEMARGAMIDYQNALGGYRRANDAMDAHFDSEAIARGDKKYKLHGALDDPMNMERYNRMKDIMDGNAIEAHYAAAESFHNFSAQSQVMKGKLKDYYNYTVPTQDVENRLKELTTSKESSKYIDAIVSGLQTLNLRGDTDIMRRQINNVLADEKVQLGTYASQALASFLVFDVKDSDPFLRRFGKYINMETAAMFNENDPNKRRNKRDITIAEYVNGEYVDHYSDGTEYVRKAKRGADVLLKGTSFKGIERTAIKSMVEGIRESSVVDGKFNYEKFKENERRIWDAIMPNIISDQFTFLSGGEPILALSKGITGVDVKERTFDWNGIFGEYAKDLTDKDKADYLEFIGKRMSDFQGGQVPGQIAKSKTDMLDAIKTQLALKNAAKNDPELARNLMNPDFKWSDPKSDPKREKVGKEYNKVLDKYWPKVQADFKGMYKEDALKGFKKMYDRGYQGEAKDALIKLLGYDQKEGTNADDDEGMPVNSGAEESGAQSDPIYTDARNEIETLYNSYGASNNDVAGFWEQVKNTIGAHPEMRGREATIDFYNTALSQYTNVAELYADIMNRLFNGF